MIKPGRRVLIVIPAHNEEKSVGAVIEGIIAETAFRDVVVIDDGSDDGTSRVVREKGAGLLVLPYNLGIGSAVQTGYKFAVMGRYEYVVRVDADGQHEAGQIAGLLEPLFAGEADMTVGSRYLSGFDYRSPLPRRAGMKLLAWLVSSIVRSKLTDTTSGFLAMNGDAISILADSSPDEYPEVESIVMLHQKGLRIKEVGVKMNPRLRGRSSITAIGSLYYMLRVVLGLMISLLRKASGGSHQ